VLELATDSRAFDLTRREADLALRLGRPRDAGLVMRKLATVVHRLYAAKGHPAARRGRADLDADAFVGFDESLAGTPQERWLARLAPNRRVALRASGTASLVAAARAGVGIAMLPCFLADADPGLVRVDPAEPIALELWLLVHGDLSHTPRVRAVIDWIDEVVRKARPKLEG
jgi:DNA-binding transcriptional LysR family regulator